MKPNGKERGAKPSEANGHTKANGMKPASRPGNGDAASERSPYAESLLATCASIPRLKAFNSFIGAAGLTELLSGDGPITIFAPTDRAFSKIPGEELAALRGDSTRVAELIRHHVVAGRVKAPRVSKPGKATPEFGEELQLTQTDRGYRVDKARIVKTNIRASNGVIHAIDTVLDPG
jgi:uncharacterized surface protein with fasciclin (FAS1) repeats